MCAKCLGGLLVILLAPFPRPGQWRVTHGALLNSPDLSGFKSRATYVGSGASATPQRKSWCGNTLRKISSMSACSRQNAQRLCQDCFPFERLRNVGSCYFCHPWDLHWAHLLLIREQRPNTVGLSRVSIRFRPRKILSASTSTYVISRRWH
ncbi:unnamed protein product, partial [Ectocarpus sp. 13 AM-2016]